MMDFTDVESSNILRIGYLPEYTLMRVVFRDGSTYDYPGVPAAAHVALMAAPSKGRHLAAHFKGGVRIPSKSESEVMPTESLSTPGISDSGPGGESVPAGPLETFSPDDCCQKLIMKMDRRGLDILFCPKCECEWRATIVDGIKHWAPYEFAVIF